MEPAAGGTRYGLQAEETSMGKRDAFWHSLPSDQDGQIDCPSDVGAFEAAIRGVMGASIVEAMDAAIGNELRLISSENPKRDAVHYERDRVLSALLRAMDDRRRDAIRSVVRRACSMTLCSLVLNLEQFPNGQVDIHVTAWGPDDSVRGSCTLRDKFMELHQLYFDWLERFSDEVEP
jgi:hypothetical protein